MAALAPQEIIRLEDGVLVLLDQRRLPAERVENRYPEWQPVVGAIQTMVVRGAPAIGVAAAYGDRRRRPPAGGRRPSRRAAGWPRPGRPRSTWAGPSPGCGRRSRLRPTPSWWRGWTPRAARLHRLEVERCEAIGRHGAALLPPGARVLTHCNTGALATGGYGTALGVIRAAHERDPQLTVWVDETRPLLQGARLTAWELEQEAIPATLITDSMAGWLMRRGEVDAVITGADRIARNGDAANKIGTYGLSVLARAHGVPFYVAAPTSTIDAGLAGGDAIPIEHRDPQEVRGSSAPADVPVYNPAFDVTPADNITALVTETGVHRPPYRLG